MKPDVVKTSGFIVGKHPLSIKGIFKDKSLKFSCFVLRNDF